MTAAEESHDYSQNEAALRRKNRNLLIVLIVVAVFLAALSYPLFNNYWDPALSNETISH